MSKIALVDHYYPTFLFLGTSAGIPTTHRACSSILVQFNNVSVLLDIGQGWYDTILRTYGEVRAKKVKLDAKIDN